MLSVGWNKRGGLRRYIIACKINVLSALLGGGGEMIAGELSDPPPVCFFFFSWAAYDLKQHIYTIKKEFISTDLGDTVDFLANMISAAAGGKKPLEEIKITTEGRANLSKAASERLRVKGRHCGTEKHWYVCSVCEHGSL